MKLRARLALTSLILSCLQLISGVVPTAANAAISYLSSSTYFAYELYTSNGSWSRPYGVTSVDYLVVAGGGRGGGSQHSTHYAGGGGGGGGVRSGTLSVGQSSYTITVGSGQTATACSAGRGGNSSLAGTDITTISATGGGSGSCNTSTSDGAGGIDGNSGGSGGGGGAQVYAKTFGAGNFGNYTPTEGFAGGTAILDTGNATNQAGGGGGGATQAGANATTGCGGKGGNGFTSSITGSSLIYGGGGGGGTRMNACGGTAGTGGGGTGGTNGAQGTSGSNGFGGGGGGTSLANGNAGGGGTVIIRYAISNPDTPDLPAISDTGESNTDYITNQTSFSLTGFATGGATVQIYNGASTIGSACTANMTTGAYSCALSGLSAGTFTFSARASFGAGAAIASTSSLTVIVDTTMPGISPAAAISLAENQSSITTISCNETCTLVMTAGVDSASVTFTPITGVLVFKNAPDFEAPGDVGSDRTYALTIRGTDVAGNITTVNYVVTITNVNENSVLGAPSVAGSTMKGVRTDLVVTSNAPGKVRFFVDGKRIANCLAITTTGSYPNYSATCRWNPAATGRRTLVASITPSDSSFSTISSPSSIFWVQKRSSAR
ncbi:MAG: hypothetical protein F2531_01885 [Actinobacteria bacterium]|nr:hypothetical protein [Actinomycetota bacterium]